MKKKKKTSFFLYPFFLFFILIVILAAIGKIQDIRKKAKEESPPLFPFDSSCQTTAVSDNFQSIKSDFWNLWKSDNGEVKIEQEKVKVFVPNQGFAGLISQKTLCGNFEVKIEFSNFSADNLSEGNARLSLVEEKTNSEVFIEYFKKENSSGFSAKLVKNNQLIEEKTEQKETNSAALKLVRHGAKIEVFYNLSDKWISFSSFNDAFNTPGKIAFAVKSFNQNPKVEAYFDNFLFQPLSSYPNYLILPSDWLMPSSSPLPTNPSLTSSFSPTPSTTPSPSLTPTPSLSTPTPTFTPTPTPTLSPTPTFTPSPTPSILSSLKIRFKAKLAHTQNNPPLYFKLRIKEQNRSFPRNICQTPPEGMKDLYIPVKADANGLYQPVEKIEKNPLPNTSLATVSSDGYILLDFLKPNVPYSFFLKGPKTRSLKMAENVIFKTESNNTTYDFDWTNFPLEPGDLPNPQNNLLQDCLINSLDLSLIISRLGKTDAESLEIADVNYDGVVNGNDLAKIITTLSAKTDEE